MSVVIRALLFFGAIGVAAYAVGSIVSRWLAPPAKVGKRVEHRYLKDWIKSWRRVK